MSSIQDNILTAEQAYQKTQDKSLILIDIRRPDEWEKTGIAQNSYAITMEDTDFLPQLEKIVNSNKNQPIGIICAAGGRSARVCQALRQQDYNYIYDVSEGMNGGSHGAGWINKNLPVTKWLP